MGLEWMRLNLDTVIEHPFPPLNQDLISWLQFFVNYFKMGPDENPCLFHSTNNEANVAQKPSGLHPRSLLEPVRENVSWTRMEDTMKF